jgi:hypothetical protein
METDQEFFAHRAKHRAAAEGAEDMPARKAHLELAAGYLELSAAGKRPIGRHSPFPTAASAVET